MIPRTACIAHWQTLAAVNAARGAWACQKRDVVAVLAGGGFLVIYEAHSVHAALRAAAPDMQPHSQILLAWAAAMSAAAGVWRGVAAARAARAQLAAPWLAVLPWDGRERRMALRIGCLVPGLVQMLGVLALTALLASWETYGFAIAASGACGVAFLVMFAAAVLVRRGKSGNWDFTLPDRAGPVRPARSVAAGLARIDSMRPKWVGTWAMRGRGPRAYAASMTLGLLIVAAGCAIGAAQHWPLAAGAAAAFAGHMVFVTTLDCRPLLSPALRVAPVGFAPAVLAILRGPVAASGSLYVVGCLAGVSLARVSAGMAASGGGVMLLLDAAFASVACALPASRGGAAALYGAAMLLTAYEHIEYGDAIYLCPAALTLFMCRQGRLGFRHYA